MKKIICALAAILVFVNANAQTPNFQWAKGMGSSGDDKGNSIAVDASGNVYTTGSFSATADFDPGPGIYSLDPLGTADIFISKLDANGNFVWAKQIGGNNAGGSGNCIKLDVSGNIYVTGYQVGNTDLDPGPGTYTVPSSSGNVFVLKLDAGGNFVWARSMGSASYSDYGMGIAVSASGDVYTTGYFRGVGDFDPGPSTFNLNGGTSDDDIFISKLNALGNFVWAKRIGGGGVGSDDQAFSIALDANDNVYTTGVYIGTVDFDPSGSIYNMSSNVNDAFISKLDASGNFVWAKKIGGSNDDRGDAIAIDHAGNLLVTGVFWGTVDFDLGAPTYTLNSATFGNYTAKYDNSGNFIWAKNMGFLQYNYYTPVAVDATNNVYITGRFGSTNDFDPGAGVYNMTAVGSYGIYVLKLDSVGNFVWAQSNGGSSGSGTNDRSGRSIVVDAANNIYTTGIYGLTVDFDMGPGTYTLTSTTGTNSNDIYVLKMGQTTCVAPASPTSTTTFSNQSVCTNNTTTLTATSAGTINWYATSTSTAVLGAGNSFVTPILSTGTYTYYAEASTCTVSATRTAIDVTVNPTPTITISASSSTICNGSSAILTASGAVFYNWSTGPLTQSISVSPTATSTYSVSGGDINGCSSFSSININVNSLPNVVANATSLSICNGNTVTLSGAGANTYTWTNGVINGVSFSPTTTITYSVTGTDANGCMDNAVRTITVNPLPTLMVSTTSTLMCTGETATLTANGTINTYTWSTTDNTSSIIVTPTATTTYTVDGTDINGCSNSTTITQSVSLCTGIETMTEALEATINIYPNPATEILFIENVLNRELQIKLFDVNGKLIHSETSSIDKLTIDITSFAKGVYLLNINTSGNDRITKKVIKQ